MCSVLVLMAGNKLQDSTAVFVKANKSIPTCDTHAPNPYVFYS